MGCFHSWFHIPTDSSLGDFRFCAENSESRSYWAPARPLTLAGPIVSLFHRRRWDVFCAHSYKFAGYPQRLLTSGRFWPFFPDGMAELPGAVAIVESELHDSAPDTAADGDGPGNRPSQWPGTPPHPPPILLPLLLCVGSRIVPPPKASRNRSD